LFSFVPILLAPNPTLSFFTEESAGILSFHLLLFLLLLLLLIIIIIIIIIAIATRRPHLHSQQSDAPQHIKTLDSTDVGCHKYTHCDGSLEARKLLSDHHTALTQQMWTSWCRNHLLL
jgi:hypothetical protein